MTFKAENKCPECGGQISAGSAHCPVCMLGKAIGEGNSLADVSGDTTSTIDLGPVTQGVGDTIGSYSLLEKLGEGGFGVVWAAEQKQPVKRRVALKIIKLGMDTKQVVARFEAERQALAMMDHPNIAKVLDAGSTDTGRPYFVMELVKGIPTTKYFDQEGTEVAEKLRLFIRVCQAIQHAHQKGIIHRDIKPSNILITLHDGTPVPKVIDFGIAKATQGDLTDKTIYTQYSQFIGTPVYMSPEQAELSGLDIDTRTDVYSLGVLLYEILTGTTPFDRHELARSGLDAMRKIIREREPEKPSTRMSQTLAQGKVNRSRVLNVEMVSRVRGDLDWIVMKCLEKDRTRRYETATGLAQDVERHLNDEPVMAAAPTFGYQLQKLYRRHRGALRAAAVVVGLLMVALVFSSWQAYETSVANGVAEEALEREAEEREAAEAERDKSKSAREEAERLRKLADEAQEETRRELYAVDMGRAHDLLSKNQVTEASRILERYLPGTGGGDPSSDIREFTWFYLRDQIRTHEYQGLPALHEGEIVGMVFSPDGRLLVSTSSIGEVFIWDTQERRLIRRLLLPDEGADEVPSSKVWANPEFSSDGKFLIVREASSRRKLLRDNTLECLVWRRVDDRFQPLKSFSYNAFPFGLRLNMSSAVRFIAGTHQVVVARQLSASESSEMSAVIYDVESEEEVGVLPNAGTIMDVSPNGKRLLTRRWLG